MPTPFKNTGCDFKWTRAALAIVMFAVVSSVGCNRGWYRDWADRDAYCLLESRQTNPLWELPKRTVEADGRSRLADHSDPDFGPRPGDDAAASSYLNRPYGFDNQSYYGQIPLQSEVETYHWLEYLDRNDDGKVILSRDSAVELALLHSREFQSRIEQIYLAALALSGNRFEFDVNWFGGTSTQFNASGSPPTAVRRLSETTRIGLIKRLAAGGQLAATLVNSFVWELGSNKLNAATGSMVITLTQPLLRGAFKHVRLESLSQSERSLLYQVRDFARFRRQFYLNITSGYRSLLTQMQSVRNQRTNLENLELSLREHEYLFARQQVSQLQVDQVYQTYQTGRISLLASEQNYENSMDAFKFQLGLPASIEFELDESLLEPFQLNDPKLEDLDQTAQDAYRTLIQVLPPEVPKRELLVTTHEKVQELTQGAAEILPSIIEEFEEWEAALEDGPRDLAGDEEKLDHDQQVDLAKRIGRQLHDLEVDMEDDLKVAEQFSVDDPTANRTLLGLQSRTIDHDVPTVLNRDESLILAWRQLSRLLGTRLRERIANMFIAQTQIRLFRISITPCDISEADALQQAHCNRLDLMNQRAILMDAFRQIEIAADSLESDLNVTATANLGTEDNNPFRFDSGANSYSVGVEFDGPLNRFNERNSYRASQISYQSSRRALMQAKDGITNQVRSDLRSLRISWLNFQISRQQLIAATRQVDEAQFQLRTALGGNDSSLTQDLLNALQGLLSAKNNLISNWTAYENARITLFVDLELLYLDENGNWINERYNPADEQVLQQTESADDSGFKRGTEEENELNVDKTTQSDGDDNSDQRIQLVPPNSADKTTRRNFEND